MDESAEFTPFDDLLNVMLNFSETTTEGDVELDEDGTYTRPFVPLRGMILYPQMVTPLFVGRERSLAALAAAAENSESLIVAAQRHNEVEDPAGDDIFDFGTEVVLGRTIRLPDRSSSVLTQGRRRVELVSFTQWDPYIRVRVRPLEENDNWSASTEALMRAVLDLFEQAVELNRKLPEEALTFATNAEEPGWLADFVASTLDISILTKQELLEILDPEERLRRISIVLGREVDLLETENRIHSNVQSEIDRNQREHFLREQIRAIQGELGETDVFTREINELHELAAKAVLPEPVRAKVDKEIGRITSMPPMSPEIGVIRTYLDWLLQLPWQTATDDNLDVANAAAVLDRDHFALDKVKDRILEYIAVRSIASDEMRTPILCFVGPPGTGKTSIAASIAEALGRNYVRLSLGGMHDEAEIRGHRRTYIGAMPGRIVQSLRRAGSNNPLFVLDEIDKIGQDFRGDPASALLEVLDPEQNKAFQDHYLELDLDLSDVLFLTTANQLETIPSALRDRLEIIEFAGYLAEEKMSIAREFLLPRQLREHGLTERGVRVDDSALESLVTNYTREAGVRNLDRELATLCRKIARQVVEGKRYPKRISAKQVGTLLGRPKIMPPVMRKAPAVGIVTGVAWTAVGGDVLDVEVNLMTGTGKLELTGNLGSIMKESAQAALSYVRSQADTFGINSARFASTDIHVHVPEGAVPKDGPSAGVTIATAMISAFTERPVRHDIAMTGEITLRGQVLPIGGTREKALAARRNGIKTVVIPARNEADLDDIPVRLRQEIEFVLADTMDAVLNAALVAASE